MSPNAPAVAAVLSSNVLIFISTPCTGGGNAGARELNPHRGHQALPIRSLLYIRLFLSVRHLLSSRRNSFKRREAAQRNVGAAVALMHQFDRPSFRLDGEFARS